VNRESQIFCALALAASLALCAAGFQFAAIPKASIEAARRPVPPQALPDVNVGGGFGKVSVVELVGYYIENPPVPAAGDGAVPAVKRFRGC
jgi:hypothetical protein